MSSEEQRAEVMRDVVERVSAWNEFRTDDFQDATVKAVNGARELWRDDETGELPRRGADPGFDALMEIAGSADGSPMQVRDALSRLLRFLSGRATASR